MTPRANRPKKSKDGGDGVTLSVRIQPRASKNEIARMEGGGIKIRLTAPPVDGAANEALVRLLSDVFCIPKSQVEIIAGHTSRDKVIRINRIAAADIDRVLNKARSKA